MGNNFLPALPYLVRCVPGGKLLPWARVMTMAFLEKLLSAVGEDAQTLLLWTLRVSCVMAGCSLLLLVHIGGLSPRTYALYRLAAELESSSGAFLLCGNFAAVLTESLRRR